MRGAQTTQLLLLKALVGGLGSYTDPCRVTASCQHGYFCSCRRPCGACHWRPGSPGGLKLVCSGQRTRRVAAVILVGLCLAAWVSWCSKSSFKSWHWCARHRGVLCFGALCLASTFKPQTTATDCHRLPQTATNCHRRPLIATSCQEQVNCLSHLPPTATSCHGQAYCPSHLGPMVLNIFVHKPAVVRGAQLSSLPVLGGRMCTDVRPGHWSSSRNMLTSSVQRSMHMLMGM